MRLYLPKLIFLIFTALCCQTFNAQIFAEPEYDAEYLKKADRMVHFGDVVDIDVVGSFEYDWRGKLNPEGFLGGPDKFGLQLFALCKSEEDIAAQITKEYSKMLREPTIIVRIIDASQRPFATLNGAVRVPHRFQIRRPVRINELIVIAGGLFDTLSGEISVYRPPDSSCAVKNSLAGAVPRIMNIKISELLSGDSNSNPFILPGDIVTVLDAKPIYIIGGVRNPRTIPSRSEVTLSRALSAAGGVARNGLESSIVIFRHENGAVTRIETDLAAIISGKSDDIELKAFDIVDVGIRGGQLREMPPVIENERFYSNENSNMPTRIID